MFVCGRIGESSETKLTIKLYLHMMCLGNKNYQVRRYFTAHVKKYADAKYSSCNGFLRWFMTKMLFSIHLM